MTKSSIDPGDVVHVYRSTGEYVWTAVYMGEVPIESMLSEEGLTEYTEAAGCIDAEVVTRAPSHF